ncbi:tetratricopeptide repeat-containing sulfotransferase family protein [Methylomonas rosea]|uniref:Sulfotransferase n=1 Tax=Methylomonas rosea TaxID=2952227 RepID=A0ABT1TR59_9GAMM|nr:tetratricopeptide repeat-containing sulfotransferase family protein [Methylomonas sp. WSC-7]MCQ8117260.1 sulfotransferase [Methylomonas sp. WSC-7]
MQRGQQAIQNKNIPEAIEWFSKALTETPKDPQVLACLGQALCWLGDRKQGLIHLKQSGQLLLKKAKKSRDIGMSLNLAEQLQHWNDFAGSLEICKQASQINPREVRTYQLLALNYMRLNQKKSALAAGRQAVKLVPDNATLSILLATLEIEDRQFIEAKQRLQKVLQYPLLKPEEKFRTHKELAKTLDKLHEYGEVFQHLHAAGEVSALLPEVKSQDHTMVPKMLNLYKTDFDEQLLKRWADTPFPKDHPAPIFLVGFMRTGTTLTQEVLAAHPKVFVADETDLVVSLVNELKRISGNVDATVPQQLRSLNIEGITHLRSFYWQRARALFGDTIDNRTFLDKTTMNSIDIGLIHTVFPDAKLIFLLRDPRDVCLSCFMQTMTPNPSTVHLLTWEGTARFYALLMDWWQTVKPKLTMPYYELRYEDAIANFEPTFRSVFQFLDLEWSPAAADFHKYAARKLIASPSFSQVAQPLYSSSVARWRNYQDQFDQINAYLQPYLKEYGYL